MKGLSEYIRGLEVPSVQRRDLGKKKQSTATATSTIFLAIIWGAQSCRFSLSLSLSLSLWVTWMPYKELA